MSNETTVQRSAVCECGRVARSSRDLFLFTDRGEGSTYATGCRCGMAKVAHDPEAIVGNVDPRTPMEQGLCTGYSPRGASGMDSYRCGDCGSMD